LNIDLNYESTQCCNVHNCVIVADGKLLKATHGFEGPANNTLSFKKGDFMELIDDK
jgi:hypothetical protein